MARMCYGATVSGTINGRPRVGAAGPADDPYTGAAETAVNGAITTLVADGASPTQAHVTALNSAWTTFKAGPTFGDVVISFNTAAVTSKGHLRQAIAEIMAQIGLSE